MLYHQSPRRIQCYLPPNPHAQCHFAATQNHERFRVILSRNRHPRYSAPANRSIRYGGMTASYDGPVINYDEVSPSYDEVFLSFGGAVTQLRWNLTQLRWNLTQLRRNIQPATAGPSPPTTGPSPATTNRPISLGERDAATSLVGTQDSVLSAA